MAEIDIIHEIEMQLLTLDRLDPPEKECNIMLTIQDVGNWILKLRYDGNIFNNRELVLSDSIKTDAHLIFAGATCFQQLLKGTLEFDAAFKVDALKFHGDENCLQSFKSRCKRRMDINAIENATLPIRGVRLPKSNEEMPIKSGWLFKKRDIISGWKCRYFEIYKNKLNYYIDQNESMPRGTISLEGAVVHPVKRVTMRRSSHHFGIVIEAKNPDRVLRLASEKTLDDGQTEADSWYQAFLYATQSGSIQESLSKKHAVSPPSEQGNKSPSKHSYARRNSFLLMTGDSDEPITVYAKAKYATVLILVFSCWHYLYAIQQLIGWKLYLTGIIGLLGLIIVFFLEMFSSSHPHQQQQQQQHVDSGVKSAEQTDETVDTLRINTSKKSANHGHDQSALSPQSIRGKSSPTRRSQLNKEDETLKRVSSYSSLEDYDDGGDSD